MHFLKMKGREVFRFAVSIMPAATRQVLERAGLTLADVSLIIPHQANRRITNASIRAIGLPEDHIYSNVERYGNTSAASIPIALCEAVEENRIHRDDLVVFVGFGAGLTWAATAIRWSAPLPAVHPTRWEKAWYGVQYRYAAIRSLIRRVVRWVAARFSRDE
jgi:3-oxoacyl-[acyl-carrier-protein] synthase-3